MSLTLGNRLCFEVALSPKCAPRLSGRELDGVSEGDTWGMSPWVSRGVSGGAEPTGAGALADAWPSPTRRSSLPDTPLSRGDSRDVAGHAVPCYAVRPVSSAESASGLAAGELSCIESKSAATATESCPGVLCILALIMARGAEEPRMLVLLARC